MRRWRSSSGGWRRCFRRDTFIRPPTCGGDACVALRRSPRMTKLARDRVFRSRNPLRLRGYDFTEPGIYFVTMNTHARRCWFGDIVDGVVRLNDYGRIARERWMAIPVHHPFVELDAFVVMPNHLHGIIRVVGR